MDRIQGANNVDIGGGKRGFRNQNKLAGIAGTVLEALWLNGVQEELAKVIETSGQVLDEEDNTQLWKALRFMQRAGLYVVDTGTANAKAVAPGTPMSQGSLMLVKIAVTNTGAATIAVDGAAAVALQRRDGSALQAGDVVAGEYRLLVFTGGAWRLQDMTEATAAEVAAGASGAGFLTPRRLTAKPASSFDIQSQQSIPNATFTTITAATNIRHQEFVDTVRASMSFTFGAKDAGVWQVNASGQIASAGAFSVVIRKNGGTLVENNVASGAAVAASALHRFAAADVLEFMFRQVAGAAQQVTAVLSASRFGA